MNVNDRGSVPSEGGLPFFSTGFLLAFTAAAAEEIYTQAVSEYDLKPIHVGVLELLRAGPDKQARLSERLSVFKPVMVGIINELEAMALVERRPHPNDGRAVQVHLLDAGIKRLELVEQANEQATEAVFGMLSEKDRVHLHEMLLQIAQSLPRHERPPSSKGRRPK